MSMPRPKRNDIKQLGLSEAVGNRLITIVVACAVCILTLAIFLFLFADKSSKSEKSLWSMLLKVPAFQVLSKGRPSGDEGNSIKLPIPLIEVKPNPGQIERHILRTPESICQLIQDQGFQSEGWQPSRIAGIGWECLADLELVVKGRVKASAFFSMRGITKDRVTAIRLKFNLPPDREGRKAYANQLAEQTLIPLFRHLRWTFPVDLREKIRDLAPIETTIHAVKFNLFEEYDTNQFVHLLLTMPKDKLPFIVSDGQVRSVFIDHKVNAKARSKPERPRSTNRRVIELVAPLKRDEDGVIIPDDESEGQFTSLKPTLTKEEEEATIIDVDTISDKKTSGHIKGELEATVLLQDQDELASSKASLEPKDKAAPKILEKSVAQPIQSNGLSILQRSKTKVNGGMVKSQHQPKSISAEVPNDKSRETPAEKQTDHSTKSNQETTPQFFVEASSQEEAISSKGTRRMRRTSLRIPRTTVPSVPSSVLLLSANELGKQTFRSPNHLTSSGFLETEKGVFSSFTKSDPVPPPSSAVPSIEFKVPNTTPEQELKPFSNTIDHLSNQLDW